VRDLKRLSYELPNLIVRWQIPVGVSISQVQGDQKVSVHLIITIQKVTGNVQSVPRQSPDIYWQRQGQGDTRLTLTPSDIPNSNYVIMISYWNCLKYFCVFLYCSHQVHRDFLITLYMYWVIHTQHYFYKFYSRLHVSAVIASHHQAFCKSWYRKNYKLHDKDICSFTLKTQWKSIKPFDTHITYILCESEALIVMQYIIFFCINFTRRPDDGSQLEPKRVALNKTYKNCSVSDWFNTYTGWFQTEVHVKIILKWFTGQFVVPE
jgi:hypothetical protein